MLFNDIKLYSNERNVPTIRRRFAKDDYRY